MTEKSLKVLLFAFPVFLLLGVSIPYDDIYRGVFFGILVPVTLLLLFIERSRFLQSAPRSIWLAAILLSYLFLSAFWSIEVDAQALRRYFRWYLETVLFVACVYFLFQEIHRRTIGYRTILHSIVFIAVLIALALYFASDLYPQRLKGAGFLAHEITGPSVLISLWVTGFLDRTAFSKQDIAITVLATLAVAIYTLLSQSRGPLISLIILFIIYFLIYLKFSKILIYGLLLTAVILSVAVNVFSVDSSLFNRLLDRSDSLRIIIWANTLQDFWNQPIFGVGIATDFRQTTLGINLFTETHQHILHPHNILLSVLYYSGTVGLSVFFVYVSMVLYAIYQTVSTKDKILRLVSISAVFMLFSTDGYRLISSPSAMWLIFWLPFAAIMAMSSCDRLHTNSKGSS